MRFDETAELVMKTTVSDGMGGYTETMQVIATISIATAQIAQDLTLNQYGYEFAKDMRLFTKYKGLKQGDILKIEDKPFKVIRVLEYPHISSMVVEAQ